MTLSWKELKKLVIVHPLIIGVTCLVIILGFVVLNSIRWTPPIFGGVAELTSVNINGSKQWLLIRGQKKDAPIILFLHGGPGNAQIGVFRHYQRDLEKNYIVVQWDQRGAGLSANPLPSQANLSKDQFVDDGIKVVEYLKARFNKEKIYLVGHAWGTALGWFMVQDYPEHFYAYAAFNQVAMGNQETYQYVAVLGEAEKRQNAKAIAELKELGSPPWKFMPSNPEKGATEPGYASMLKVVKWAKAFRGESYRKNIDHVFTRDLIFSSEYTFKDISTWEKAKSWGMNFMYPWANANVRLVDKGTSFEVPFYMFLGNNDLIAPTENAAELFDNIQAPDKRLVIYTDTSHYIFWERTYDYQAALLRIFNKHETSHQENL